MTTDENTDVAEVDEADGVTADGTDESISDGTDEATADGADEAAAGEADAATNDGDEPPKRVRSGWRKWFWPVVLVIALVASAGVAAWLYFFQYRPDQQTNAAAAKVAIDAASQGTIALLSYSPDSLDKDFAAAKSHLTGDFLNYYTQFTEQIVTPAAQQKSVKTSASVVRSAVSELEPERAVVLVFVNQTTTSKENPDGAFAASSVKVGMTKIDDRWLINAFDPV